MNISAWVLVLILLLCSFSPDEPVMDSSGLSVIAEALRILLLAVLAHLLITVHSIHRTGQLTQFKESMDMGE